MDDNYDQTRNDNKDIIHNKNTIQSSEVPYIDIETDETASKYLPSYETNTQDSTVLPLKDHTNGQVVMSSRFLCETLR